MSTLVLFVRPSAGSFARLLEILSLGRVHASFARPCGRAFARLLLFSCSFASSCAFKTFIDELNISITIVISVKSVIANIDIENEIPLDRQFKRHEGFKHFHHEGSRLAQREKNFEVYIGHTV